MLLRGREKVDVHCIRKPERGARDGMPEMPEINWAEFDQRPAGWSQFSDGRGWISRQATACHRIFSTLARLSCLLVWDGGKVTVGRNSACLLKRT